MIVERRSRAWSRMASADEVIDRLARGAGGAERSLADLKHIHWNGRRYRTSSPFTRCSIPSRTSQNHGRRHRRTESPLGGSPNGLAGYLAQRRTWNDYSINRATAQAHLAALDLWYTNLIAASAIASTRWNSSTPCRTASCSGSPRKLEQQHWFVRAHLEDSAGGMQHAGTVTERAAAARSSTDPRAVQTLANRLGEREGPRFQCTTAERADEGGDTACWAHLFDDPERQRRRDQSRRDQVGDDVTPAR